MYRGYGSARAAGHDAMPTMMFSHACCRRRRAARARERVQQSRCWRQALMRSARSPWQRPTW
jgi:hypothetical protein